ncbi:MAG: P-type conjugative transfer protein TrbL, partial [Burkholderiaceae bacterium]
MKKLPVLPVVCITLLLFAAQAHAAPLDSSGLLDNILQKFHDAASHWQGKVISHASWLFWTLALLSMTWTFGMMALKNAGITEALAEIIRFFAVTGFFWWLLLNGPAISTSIIDSLRQISAEASGLGNNLSPSGIVDIGFDIVSKVVDQSSMWSPVNSAIGLIVAGVILICLALV